MVNISHNIHKMYVKHLHLIIDYLKNNQYDLSLNFAIYSLFYAHNIIIFIYIIKPLFYRILKHNEHHYSTAVLIVCIQLIIIRDKSYQSRQSALQQYAALSEALTSHMWQLAFTWNSQRFLCVAFHGHMIFTYGRSLVLKIVVKE